MKVECAESLMDCNREIEFNYFDKRYSITYYEENGKRTISFCEFYKEPTHVRTADEALQLKIGSKTLMEIFAGLPDSVFDIY